MANSDDTDNEFNGRFNFRPPGTATVSTRANCQLVADHLPLADQLDFENARRGLRYQISDGIILNIEIVRCQT